MSTDTTFYLNRYASLEDFLTEWQLKVTEGDTRKVTHTTCKGEKLSIPAYLEVCFLTLFYREMQTSQYLPA